jgi:hypothetical protein
MKLLILYRPNSEFSRPVDEFVQTFNRVYPGYDITLVDVDSIEGIRQMELYDLMEYPAILAMIDDGSVLNSWVGKDLPLIDEVAGFLRS